MNQPKATQTEDHYEYLIDHFSIQDWERKKKEKKREIHMETDCYLNYNQRNGKETKGLVKEMRKVKFWSIKLIKILSSQQF